jgi:DNA-binding MarR family transcriptional regulator
MSNEERSRQFMMQYWEQNQRINRVYSRWAAEGNRPFTIYVTLEYLWFHPEGAEPAYMADSLYISRQNMTSIIDSIEREGYAVRFSHATDRRRKLVKLTDAGFNYTKTIHSKLWMQEDAVLEAFSKEERLQLIALTSKLAVLLESHITNF